MAIPNYTYLKLKMPGPKGVITVGSSFEHAYECDVECVEHAEALALDEALAAQLQGMAEEAMDSKQRHAGTFKPAEGTKDVPLKDWQVPLREGNHPLPMKICDDGSRR